MIFSKKTNFVVAAGLLAVMLFSVATEARKIKIMPIGDSITSARRNQASYRYYLWKMLEAAGISGSVDFVGSLCGVSDTPYPPMCGSPPYLDWDWDHEGYAATSTREWLESLLSPALDANVPDIVLIHYGTNDFCIDGRNTGVPTNNISIGIDSIRTRNPRAAILLAQIIPFKGFFGDSVPEYNRRLANLAAQKTTAASPVILVDQYTGYDVANNPDGFHPNELGYQIMASKWQPPLFAQIAAVKQISAAIAAPQAGASVHTGDLVPLSVKAKAGTGIRQVRFFRNTQLIGNAVRVNDSLFTFDAWRPARVGTDTIRTFVTDNLDSTYVSEGVVIQVTETPVPWLSIMAIQDTGSISPYNGRQVITWGVATGVQPDSACFWIQDPRGDGNPRTSDAVRVDRSALAYYKPHTGDSIIVKGVVAETGMSGSSTITNIIADTISLLSSNAGLPVVLSIPFIPPNASFFPSLRAELERHEGMLVRLDNSQVVAPSNAGYSFSLAPQNNANAAVSPWVLPTIRHDAAVGVDYLSYILDVAGGNSRSVFPGDVIAKCVGVLGYNAQTGGYCILPFPDSLEITSIVTPPAVPVSRRATSGGTLRITSLNLGGLFDTLDAPGKSDVVVSAGDYALRIEKLSRAIIDELVTPAVICMQGGENRQVFDDLAGAVNLRCGRGYKAVSTETLDPQGLENGFLYDTSAGVALFGSKLLPAAGLAGGERQTLLGGFLISGYRLFIANVDFVDRRNDARLFGPDWPPPRPAESLRCAQAAILRAWIDSTLAAGNDRYIIAGGRFNSYSFTEPGAGGVHALSVVTGNASAGQAVFYNVEQGVFPEQGGRFTMLEEGRASMISSILLSPALLRSARGADILHFNAGWPAGFSGDATTTIRACNEDPVEVRF